MKTVLVTLCVKDTEKVDWVKGLSSYLKRSYGSSQWSQFYDLKLTQDLDRLRNNANGESVATTLLDQNYKYYAYLEQLALRLGNNSGQLKLEFTWYDAEHSSRDKSLKYTQHTLALEKSSVLYNIGALLTQVAEEKLSDDYKTCVGFLSKAVGCFEYLSSNFLNSPSVDLQAQNTKFLADLCHSEAQEVFLIKIINSPDVTKHASLISKLSLAAANFYERCDNFYKKDEEESGFAVPYGEVKWKSIITCKMYFYRGISAYNYGLSLEQQSKVGEAIAFLKVAAENLVSAVSHKLYTDDDMDMELIKTMVDEKLKVLIKDNDYIYHDTVPQDVKLESIKPMDAINPQEWMKQLNPYMDEISESCNALFKGIVPLEVYEKESIYSEEKANMLRGELDGVETANWEYTSFIEFTNLPNLIQDLEKRFRNGGNGSDEDPRVVMMKDQLGKWQSVVKGSQYKDVDTQMKQIVEKRDEIMNLMKTIPVEHKDNAVKLKSSLVAASQSDEKLFSLVIPYIEEIKLLSNSDLLWKNFNKFSSQDQSAPSLLDLDDSKNEQILAKLKHIKEQYENLRLLREERSRNVKDLKEEMTGDDITKVLIMNRGKSDVEMKKIFQVELDKFRPLSTRIEATIYKQASTINAIKITLDEIFRLTGVQSKSTEQQSQELKREEFYAKLEQAMTNFTIFSNDLPKGLSFYDSLLKMTRELVNSAAPQATTYSNQSYSPPLPFQPGATRRNSLDERFRQLSMSSNVSPGSSFCAGSPAPPVPPVPPRTYSDTIPIQQPSISSFSNHPPAPPIPPKQPPSGISDLVSREQQRRKEEQEFEQNPTSFYNNPSVFNENLYSKFSG